MVRVITAIGLWGSLLGVVLGTNEASARNAVAGRALLPSAEALDRLNLRQEWAIQLPIEVNRDRIMQVQTIDDQLFVQTRTGLLFAIDVHTGRIQWQKQLGNGEYAVTHPAAANSRFVYVTHVTRLYAFHRYSGVVEFEVDLGSEPSAGLAADNTGVYCILGLRSGSSAAHRITVYNLIQPIAVPDQQRKGTSDLQRQGIKEENQKPLNELMQRYAPGSMRSYNIEQEIPLLRPQVPPGAEPTGGYTGSRTPSLSPLPRITPPYTLSNENYTP
ncbi:MAG: hypothetical protein NZ703_05630, partial [Gemmataceae bacterium]|nr:hypothetical protein [Gemmataceae bacterium]